MQFRQFSSFAVRFAVRAVRAVRVRLAFRGLAVRAVRVWFWFAQFDPTRSPRSPQFVFGWPGCFEKYHFMSRGIFSKKFSVSSQKDKERETQERAQNNPVGCFGSSGSSQSTALARRSRRGFGSTSKKKTRRQRPASSHSARRLVSPVPPGGLAKYPLSRHQGRAHGAKK